MFVGSTCNLFNCYNKVCKRKSNKVKQNMRYIIHVLQKGAFFEYRTNFGSFIKFPVKISCD